MKIVLIYNEESLKIDGCVALLTAIDESDIITTTVSFGEFHTIKDKCSDYDCVLIFHGTVNSSWCRDYYDIKSVIDNVLFIKDGCIRDKWEIDALGYSGDSELYIHKDSIMNELMKLDEDTIEEKRIWYSNYVDNNKSKIQQFFNKFSDTESSKFLKGENFILITGQQHLDSVIKHSHFGKYENTILNCIRILNDQGIKIIYRPHPAVLYDDWYTEEERIFTQELSNSNEFENLFVEQGQISIHELIENCSSVVTINSGTGFEGLLHHKNVFNLGKSDYCFLSHECKTDNDIRNIKNLMYKEVDKGLYDRFICYYDLKKLFDVQDINDMILHMK
jgi:hypothetical protein